MAYFSPVYLCRVYAPRSIDPTETTLLAPPPGALHTDYLVVSTSMGAAIGQPYMRVPQGRRGRLDAKSKEFDVGQMTVTIGDMPIDGLNDQSKRWFSQFIGGDNGIDYLLMCKIVVYEALDGQAFVELFTGRINSVKQTGTLEYQIVCKDFSDDIKDDIFYREPNIVHVPYAFMGYLQPQALPKSWVGFPPGPTLGAKYTGIVDHKWRFGVVLITPTDYKHTIMTQSLFDPSIPSSRTADVGVSGLFGQTYTYNYHFAYNENSIKARITRSGVTTDYWLRTIDTKWYDDEKALRVTQFSVSKIHPFDPDPNSDGTYAFVKPGTLSTASCLFIDSVHPITLLRDLLKGEFGLLDSNNLPVRSIPVNEISFGILEADTSFGTCSFRITEKDERKKWISDNICKAFSIAITMNAYGEVEVFDMRASTMPPDLYTVTDVDLISVLEGEGWKTVADDAISRMDVTYYSNTRLNQDDIAKALNNGLIDPVCAGLSEEQQPMIELDINKRTLDFGERPFVLDLKGIRALPFTFSSGFSITHSYDTDGVAQKLAEELSTPFRQGGRYLMLTCERNHATEAIQVGTRNGINISTMPDPLTKVHGGPRFALCIERNEDGPKVVFTYLDLGSLSEADPPVLDDPIQDVTNPEHQVIQGITPNAALDPVQIQYAITDTTISVVPGPGDSSWKPAGNIFDPDLNLTITGLPATVRVWTRGRSNPRLVDGGIGGPSIWVYPPGVGYVDTDGLGAPTGLTLLPFSATVLVSFTPADPSLRTQVLSHVGPLFTAWTDADVQTVMPAGASVVLLTGFTLGTTYTIAVRHLDQFGQPQAMAFGDVTIGGSALQAPRPAGLSVVTPSAIILSLFASNPAFEMKLERAADDGTGNAPNVGTSTVIATHLPGGTQRFQDNQPVDGKIWWYRLYHTLSGYTDSDPTPWVKAIATAGQPPSSSPIVPIILEQKSQTSTVGTLTLVITDPQNRVTEVAFKHQSGTTAETAYVVDSTLPYSSTVTLVDGKRSSITYRVKGYGADGQLTTFIEKAVFFDNNNSYALPRDVGFIMGSGVIAITLTESPIRFWVNDDFDIMGWTISNDQSGSIVMKVETATFAAYPTFTDQMTTQRPTITAARKGEITLTTPVQIRGKTCIQITPLSVTTQNRVELTFHGIRA